MRMGPQARRCLNVKGPHVTHLCDTHAHMRGYVHNDSAKPLCTCMSPSARHLRMT